MPDHRGRWIDGSAQCAALRASERERERERERKRAMTALFCCSLREHETDTFLFAGRKPINRRVSESDRALASEPFIFSSMNERGHAARAVPRTRRGIVRCATSSALPLRNTFREDTRTCDPGKRFGWLSEIRVTRDFSTSSRD